jgi:hypothetical protein
MESSASLAFSGLNICAGSDQCINDPSVIVEGGNMKLDELVHACVSLMLVFRCTVTRCIRSN